MREDNRTAHGYARKLQVAWMVAVSTWIGTFPGAMLRGQDPSYPYRPVNYFPTPPTQNELRIFQFDEKIFTLPISFKLGRVEIAANGKSFYSAQRGLVRIQLDTLQVSSVPGTTEFGYNGFAVTPTENMIVISGQRQAGGQRSCGVFVLTLPDAQIRQVVNSGCNYTDAGVWTDLSVSADGQRLAGLHNRRIELLDLSRGTAESLGNDFWLASFSPDGKWLAAMNDIKHPKLILFDAHGLTHQRSLGASDGGLYWSPDSRYLLLLKDELRCGFFSEFYSMETLDVQAFRRRIVKSSRCQISGGISGWVSKEIAARP
jgi:hypothetical protein